MHRIKFIPLVHQTCDAYMFIQGMADDNNNGTLLPITLVTTVLI